MEVLIEKIVHGGYGIAYNEKSIYLIPFSVPGDVLDIGCSPADGVSFGWIKRIVTPSSKRRMPLCPVFGICGGCDFDHMDYSYEIQVKRDILLEDLSRIAKITIKEVENIIWSKEYGYRNHAQFKVDAFENVGFFERRSHDVVRLPQEGCLLLEDSINEYVKRVRERHSFKEGGFRVRTNMRGEIFKKGIPQVKDDRYVYHYINGLIHRVGIDDFFQVNNHIIDKWISQIEYYLEPESSDEVVDIFCGSGFIALNLAKKVQSVFGIELNRNAVRNAIYNAELNKIGNTNFIGAEALKGLEALTHADKVILDPPRAGLYREIIDKVVSMNPGLIVYVSCDTATFSRDMSQFIERGYFLRKIALVDMFPRTRHLEIVAQIERLKH